ncbi:FtsX-like permease family protein [Rhodocytophaga rosea]|uniref:FtsX-like permease family protein n=1 Tax=Rhodocytophaga rosea TaxID=2704465 RepID=A0A6C0GK18_9BACT|nr:ABC transporter permease [Rhodocytophaga rosea]QHT67980.1 FtsX-like permease family protein [Rhodocytophaga rosea]
MFQNYLKIALRNILKYTGFSFINIFGLALGLTCCLLISLYIRDELSYDKYHTNADRIYRVTRNWTSQDGSVSLHLGHVAPPFGPLLENEFPDIEASARIIQNGFLFRYDEKAFNENNVFIAEPAIFKIFTIPVISGDPKKALDDPFSIMLSDKMAEKYFNNENAVGKVIKIDNQFQVKITGIFKHFPANSHFHPDFLVSFSTLNDDNVYGRENLRTNFGNNSFGTYLLLPENYNTQTITSQIPVFLDKVLAGNNPNNGPKPSAGTNLFLQKLTDIHLHSHLDSEFEANSDITTLYILSAIAVFILIIACINFMNLSTALAAKRAKEVGIRKVMGVTKDKLVIQFLSESVVFSMIALVLAIGIVQLSLPALNNFTGRELSVGYLENWYTLPLLITLALIVGVIAGSYPALYLSSFQPISILKGKLLSAQAGSGLQAISLRQILVVLQFTISIVLMICTGIMFNQLNFLSNKSLGFEKDHVVTLSYFGELSEQYESFKNQLTSQTSVQQVGRSSRIPSGRLLDSNGATAQVGDSLQPTSATIKFLRVDHDFISTYKIEMAAGRNFSKEFGTDDTTAFIINQEAASMIGWKTAEEAIGKQFTYGPRKGRIIGVVKDFNFESMHQEIAPMVFFIAPNDGYNYLSVKINGTNVKETLAQIEKTWYKFLPERPFEYTFLDENFGRLYEKEQKQGQLFSTFSILAILIGCLGLFGLASFTAVQRTKEIGIRKVLGASVSGIVTLLSKEFLKLVFIANLIAWPVAWFAMSKWLDGFAYSVNISPWTFLLAALLALIIALITVSYQSIKAAIANPVKSLRAE